MMVAGLKHPSFQCVEECHRSIVNMRAGKGIGKQLLDHSNIKRLRLMTGTNEIFVFLAQRMEF